FTRPNALPGCKLAWPDLVARKVSFMQAQKFGLGRFPEMLALVRLNILSDPGSNMRACRPSVHAAAHHIAYDLPQRRAVPQPEWIGLPQRLSDGNVARGGPLISPDKHILQEIDFIQF